MYKRQGSPAAGLKDYGASLASLSKDRVIRGLARALKQAGVDVDPDASPDAIAKKLVASLPTPRASGKTISSDKKHQVNTCKLVAKVLNDEFTPGETGSRALIDTKLGPAGVCRKVSELAHSLATGMHAEFLQVHADLSRVLRSLTVLEELLSRAHDKILAQKAAADANGPPIDPALEELFQRALQEHKRQLLMLNNLVGVTLATPKAELDLMIEDAGEDYNIIRELKLVPGSSDLSDAIAYAVSGLGTSASVSAAVDKALKAVGIKIADYLQSADMKSFQSLLDSRLESGDVPATAIGEFLTHAQTLKRNFGERSSLDLPARSLETRAANLESKFGGAPDTKLDRRVSKQKLERKLMVSDFVTRSARHYAEFLKAVTALGPKIGRTAPLSDALAQLREGLARLREGRLGMVSLELALIGYHGDAAARTRKEAFLGALRHVLGSLDTILTLPEYSRTREDFAAMHSALSGLIKTIDFFSDAFAQKYGAGEPTPMPVEGGDDEEVGSKAIPEIARSAYSLEKAINAFFYYFYMAKVRENLSQTGVEVKHYGEKYPAHLGNAVSARLRTIDAEQKTRKDDLKTAGITGDDLKKCEEFLDAQTKTKHTLYRALQAIDLYMKSFTGAIVDNPDDVMKDMRRALDGVTQIAPWYNEKTGDQLAAAFDATPGAWTAGGAPVMPDITAQAGDHYYEKLAASRETNNMFTPGVPLNSVPAANAATVEAPIESAVNQFQALKNLVNTFARIGDKFGGQSLRKQQFMSPPQIYAALTQYIKGSALSLQTGADIKTAATDTKRGGVYFSTVGGRSDFVTEDKYFTFCVLAMASKVFTVIGVFDLFNRPSPVYDLTPTRMIIGGAGYDSVPEVYPDTAELYFRLLRLAEFFKVLFEMDSGAAPAATQISMMPEVEGVFSGLIRLLFVRINSGAVTNGSYSDLEQRAIIREINAIHQNFKDGGKSVGDVLSAFVMEINRRYGVVKRAEWLKLERLLKSRTSATSARDANNTNYSILPGEGDFESDRRSPADRYAKLSGTTVPVSTPGNEDSIDSGTDWANWKMLGDFRKKLDAQFATVQPEEFTSFSFSTLIHQARDEIAKASDSETKYNIAARLIQGSGSLAEVDVGKSFMFHETVVVGLNLLGGIHGVLVAARDKFATLDVQAAQVAIGGLFDSNTPINQGTLRNAVGAMGRYVVAGAAPHNLRGAGSAPGMDQNAAVYGPATAARAGNGALGKSLLTAYALDNGEIMKELITTVFSLTSTHPSLIQARFPNSANGQLSLDFSGLRGLVQQLMGDVRMFLDKFRPFISSKTLKKYEDATNPGSVAWLETHLIEGFIRGSAPDALSSGSSLEVMTRQVNQAYVALTKPAGVALAAGVVTADSKHREQYGEALCQLVFYGLDMRATASAPLTAEQSLGTLVSTSRPTAAAAITRPTTTGGVAATNHIALWSTQKGLLPNRSMLVMFNQLIAKYLKTFFDSASGKIFRGLVDSFANGAFSRAVMADGFSLPDLVTGGDFGIRGDPTTSGVLAESLALALRRVMTDTNPTTSVSDHLVATLVDVPHYMRESFRANLPMFATLFDQLQQFGEFIKQLLGQTSIDVGRPLTPLIAAGGGAGAASIVSGGAAVTSIASGTYVAGAVANSVGTLAAASSTSDDVRLLLLGLIDSIGGGCYSLAGAARGVLQEIEDHPLYLQTQEGSIQEYKRRYKQTPLMPLSSSLVYLKDDGLGPLIPEHSVGEIDFKMMYGTRGLLGRPSSRFSLAEAPGVKNNLDGFNSSASSREKIDADKYGGFVSNSAAALRFIAAVRNLNGAIASQWASEIKLVGTANGAIQADNAVFAIRNNTQVSVALTEGSIQRQYLKKIGAIVGSAGGSLGGLDRSKERLMNIIDMNIMPLNVHALMRTIPLAPILNYTYTFEQMVCLMFGATSEQIGEVHTERPLGAQGAPRNTRETFLKLLIDPCAEVSDTVYGLSPLMSRNGTDGHIQRIYRGDNSLGLGRPKFASDQLFNKTEFGSLVPTDASFDEAGPAASGRLMAGLSGPHVTRDRKAAAPNVGLLNDADLVTGTPGYRPGRMYVNNMTRQGQLGRNAARYQALTYLAEPDDNNPHSALKRVQLGNSANAKLTHLAAVGKARFDTCLTRKLFFLTNVQRVMRERIDNELSQYRSVLPEGMKIADPGVTEFGHAPARTRSTRSRRFVGPNEVSTDRGYDSSEMFVR